MPLLTDPQTRAAIHAPTSQNWTMSITYPFCNSKPASVPAYPNSVFIHLPIDYSTFDPSVFHPCFRV